MENTIQKRLKAIEKNNKENTSYINSDLYRLLYKRDLYIIAYEKIKSNKGAISNDEANKDSIKFSVELSSADADADGFSLKIIDKMIHQIKMNQFQFQPVKRVYIPKSKKSSKKKTLDKSIRPLGIPCFKDKIMQQVLRIILELIYEPSFSTSSHGFRPNKSCHTCLNQVSQQFKGVLMVIEGDIKEAFDSINHSILTSILTRRINDQRFLDLIRKLLKTGYTEFNKPLIKPLIGTPQGGIISPLLANIYLNELDNYINSIQNEFKFNIENKKTPKFTEKYSKIILEIRKKETLLKKASPKNQARLLTEIQQLKQEQSNTKVHLASSKPIKIHYTRYTDDWIIGINGPVKLASQIKSQVADFLKNQLNLDLNLTKTHITNWRQKPVSFLGFELRIDTSIKIKKLRHYKTKTFYTKRTTGHVLKFNMPIKKVISKLYMMDICSAEGKPTSKKAWTVQSDSLIINAFNNLLKGLLNYYGPANNLEALRRVQYIIKFSCAKTLAHKHKCSTHKVFKRYGVGSGSNRTLQVNVDSTDNKNRTIHLQLKPKITQQLWVASTSTSTRMSKTKNPFDSFMLMRTSKLGTNCCICGNMQNVEMHHIRHVKEAKKGKGFDKILGIINRKQIPVCRECHVSIHNGTYDQKKLSEFTDKKLACYL